MRAKRDATCCCWFDGKPSDAQLNKLEQHPLFTWKSEQTSFEGGCRWSSSWQRGCCYQLSDAEVTCFTNELPSIKRIHRAVSDA